VRLDFIFFTAVVTCSSFVDGRSETLLWEILALHWMRRHKSVLRRIICVPEEYISWVFEGFRTNSLQVEGREGKHDE
jgi:hypothetical protein